MLPFIRLLFEGFGTSKENEALLYKLLNSYKLKISMGIAFMVGYSELYLNQCNSIFNLSIQVLSPESNAIMLNSHELIAIFINRIYLLLTLLLKRHKLFDDLIVTMIHVFDY